MNKKIKHRHSVLRAQNTYVYLFSILNFKTQIKENN